MRVTRFKSFYILFVLIVSIQLIIPAAAKADGMGIGRTHIPRIPKQEAIIRYKDGIEKLIIETQFNGKHEPMGWIIPVPSEPTEIAKVSTGIFNTLSAVVKPPHYHHFSFFRTILGGMMGGGMKKSLGKKVEVIKQVDMGNWTSVVLKATDAEELNHWLKENDFITLPEKSNAILKKYIQRNWVFVASKSTTESPETDLSASISLTFPVKKPVYPMQLSSLSDGDLYLTLYVIADKTPKSKEIPLQYSKKLKVSEEDGIHFEHITFKDPNLEKLVWNGCSISRMAKTFTPEDMEKSDITLKMVRPFTKLRYDPYPLSTTQKIFRPITLPLEGVCFTAFVVTAIGGLIVYIPISYGCEKVDDLFSGN